MSHELRRGIEIEMGPGTVYAPLSWLFFVVLGGVIWIGLQRMHPERPLYPRTFREVAFCIATGIFFIGLEFFVSID